MSFALATYGLNYKKNNPVLHPSIFLLWRFDYHWYSQSPKMTAKEEREFRSNSGRPCSLWCLHLDPAQLQSECLHLDPAHRGDCTGCIHLDPAQLQNHHPIPAPKSHRSQVSIRGYWITFCALKCVQSSRTRVTSDVARVFTSWPSPLLHPSPSTESESFKGKLYRFK